MAYRGHTSTFDAIIDALAAVDSNDERAMKNIISEVGQMLSTRPREELGGVNGKVGHFAHLRINGSIARLYGLRERAIASGLPAHFVRLIEHVLGEAKVAYDAAIAKWGRPIDDGDEVESPAATAPTVPDPQPWTRDQIDLGPEIDLADL